MVFNAVVMRRFASWYGGPKGFDQDVATASGIGHNGADLVVHCLSARLPGDRGGEPAQINPHRYFRAVRTIAAVLRAGDGAGSAGLLLVGGTASIRGEDSLHKSSLSLQMIETLTNLASVVENGTGEGGRGWWSSGAGAGGVAGAVSRGARVLPARL